MGAIIAILIVLFGVVGCTDSSPEGRYKSKVEAYRLGDSPDTPWTSFTKICIDGFTYIYREAGYQAAVSVLWEEGPNGPQPKRCKTPAKEDSKVEEIIDTEGVNL